MTCGDYCATCGSELHGQCTTCFPPEPKPPVPDGPAVPGSLAEFARDARNRIVVQEVHRRRKAVALDLRIFYFDSTAGVWRATRKGVRLEGDEVGALLDAVGRVMR